MISDHSNVPNTYSPYYGLLNLFDESLILITCPTPNPGIAEPGTKAGKYVLAPDIHTLNIGSIVMYLTLTATILSLTSSGLYVAVTVSKQDKLAGKVSSGKCLSTYFLYGISYELLLIFQIMINMFFLILSFFFG